MAITLYGTEACSACKRLKMILDKKNIQYTYIDVAKQKIDMFIPTLIVEEPMICLSSPQPRTKKFEGLTRELLNYIDKELNS